MARQISTNTFAASTAFTITPNDSTDLPSAARAIYVGGTGNMVVQMASDASQVTFSGIPAGTLIPIQVSRVLATNTTATLIIGLN